MSANFFPQVSHFFIYKNFRRTRDSYPFFIVQGGALFVKVSGYSVYVYFFLFSKKDRTNSTGGDGGLSEITNKQTSLRSDIKKRRKEKDGVLRTLEVSTFTFRYATGKGGKFSRDPERIKVARMVRQALGPIALGGFASRP